MRDRGDRAADEKGTLLALTTEVGENWAEHLSREDLIEALKQRQDFGSGFWVNRQDGKAEA